LTLRQIDLISPAKMRVRLFRKDQLPSWVCGIICLVLGASIIQTRSQEAPAPNSGLAVAFASAGGGATDFAVLPNAWLFVAKGASPTPFLPAGKFTAVWSGMLDLELRSDYSFQAELNGEFKLEINGNEILSGSGKGELSPASKSVRLNKGKNSIVVRFASTPEGAAQFRLYWAPKGANAMMSPLPISALSYVTTPEIARSLQMRKGREIFGEFRCFRCHQSGAGNATIPEFQLDAPSFEGIGSRRTESWMAAWIENPRAHRAIARMPQVLHGANAKENALSAAAFLASLRSTDNTVADKTGAADVESGKKLFENLHCIACHQPPDATEAAETKIPLKEAGKKFAPGALKAFLLQPSAHYEWIRMPNFKLSNEEALQLAAFVTSTGETAAPGLNKTEAGSAQIEAGRKVVTMSGCLNCHTSNLKSDFKTKSFADLNLATAKKGCLAETAEAAGTAPYYAFSADQRDALRAFGSADKASLTRHVAADFAQHYSRILNCVECHGKFDGFPSFDVLGGKLRPEWSHAFIAGEIKYKPRPWLDARMPSFGNYAGPMAAGLAGIHGYAPITAPEGPIDQDAAKVGQKLVSAIGGFSCISCHSVGDFGATQVFESAGINFAYSGQRLLKPYFHRWVRNPLLIDPTTKMPVYFDGEGKSPLTEVYDGDGSKQREAIWQYLRLGDKMPPPPNQ
jgi:mono/diheme cytochrome c family protein